jgi:hypothetical protein
MRSLYTEWKNGGEGYADGRIRELCITAGGPELGAVYDTCVRKPVELPIPAYLQYNGMAWQSNRVSSSPSANAQEQKLAAAFPYPVK